MLGALSLPAVGGIDVAKFAWFNNNLDSKLGLVNPKSVSRYFK